MFFLAKASAFFMNRHGILLQVIYSEIKCLMEGAKGNTNEKHDAKDYQ